MRISGPVLKDVCKKMIKIILHCLPYAIRGTIYSVGPIPKLRVVRIASGQRNGDSDEIIWDAKSPSGYDYPGKSWEDYRDRPGGILEAMAWCVERQKSWTADDPEHDSRSVRKQLEGMAGEDYHHMEPVLLKKADLWDVAPPFRTYPHDSWGGAIWQDSQHATVAVIKIHFLPKQLRQSDRSTCIIKELSRSLGTEILSLHAREKALVKEMKLMEERQETYNTLAHEFRNAVTRMAFVYRAINNEISYLRESWEDLICEQLPEQSCKKTLLEELNNMLKRIAAEVDSSSCLSEILKVSRDQDQLMETCLLPHQNEMWLRYKIKPLWQSVLAKADSNTTTERRVESLLERLRRSFYLGLDRELRDQINTLPEEVKAKWVDLAYREINADTSNIIKQYIELLDNINIELPRKSYSLKNFISLQGLVELIPELEKKLNQCLEPLRNSETPTVEKYLT
jgi:hypothetical protein